MSHVKLFIPGPIEVSQKTLTAMTQPMIGHRSGDFQKLYADLQPGLRALFQTERLVFTSTSSAWGVMEGAIRNLVSKKVLNCMCGAFSDKWYDVSLKCGKQAEKLQVEWGQPITADAVRAKLSEGGFDAVTLIHNETSTGTMSPLADICAAVKEFPGVLLIVDTVSSFSVVPIPFDQLGIDVLLTGSQKALAMPPGLALFAVSQAALDRAATMKDRGYYFDFVEFQKNAENNMTPSTPVIPLLYALRSKLEDIAAEGLDARYARHAANNALVHAWGDKHGLHTLPDKTFASKSLTCFRNVNNWDLPGLNKKLKERHKMVIDGGYGKIKGLTFRISNMGDETAATMTELLNALDDVIAN